MPTLSRLITGVAAPGLVACDAQTAVEPAAYDDVAQILASSGGSALGGTLNSIHLRGERTEPAWLAAICVPGALTILAALTRPSVLHRFAARAQHAVWRSRDPLVCSARWAAIASFTAAPMLILYAFGQPVAPATVWSALVLAPVLFTGGVLVVQRRAAGVLVLGVAAVVLLAHTVASARCVAVAADVGVIGYDERSPGPAVVLGLAAAALALWRAR